jgi:altronate hydrolase
MKDFLTITDMDNVAVALNSNCIKAGHKIALCDIESGKQIIKYGYPIGNATADIKGGEWVHSHNLKSGLKEKLI